MKTAIKKVLLLGAFLAPAQILADDVTATPGVSASKTAPLQNFFPNSYGKVDLRHYHEHEKPNSSKKYLETNSYMQPRFELGSTFFEGRLDSKFIFGVENSMSSNKNSGHFEDKGTRLENDFTVYKNDYVSVIPFLYVVFPKFTENNNDKKITKGEIGIDIPVSYPILTSAGTFTLKGEVIGKTYVGTKTDPEKRVALRNQDDSLATVDDVTNLGLADSRKTSVNLTKDENNNYKLDPEGRSLYHSFSAGISYKPSFVSGLETQVLSLYETTYTPVMELNKDEKTIGARKSSGPTGIAYTKSFEPSYIFSVKYSFNDRYSLLNEFTLKDKYQGEQKYTNMVSLVAKLF